MVDFYEAEHKYEQKMEREAREEHARKVRTENIEQRHWVKFNPEKTGAARWETLSNAEIQERARTRGAVDKLADLDDRKALAEKLPGIKHFHEREFLNGRITNNTRWHAHERMFQDGRIFKDQDEFNHVLNERQRVARGRGR